MPSFGLITEGVTDQKVIENIVAGVFGDEAEVRPLQPIGDETSKGQLASFGNWGLVFKYCEAPDFEQAFQFNDYLIVQIDTDCCEEKNYDISRRDAEGNPLCPLALIKLVREKIIGLIGGAVWGAYGSRIVFAIAVDSMECWVLVLYGQGKAKTRYLNCGEPLRKALSRADVRATISNKNSREYDLISRGFSKTKELNEARKHNEGLECFVGQLEKLVPLPQDD